MISALSRVDESKKQLLFIPRAAFIPLALLMISLLGNVFALSKIFFVGVILFILQGKRIFGLIDANLAILFLFLPIYYMNNALSGRGNDVAGVVFVFFPCLLYVVGKWLGRECNNGLNFVNSLIGIAVALGAMMLLSVYDSIHSNGFSGLSRSIRLIGAGDAEVSATNLCGFLVLMVSLIGTLLLPRSNPLKDFGFLAVIFFNVLAVGAIVRLGSRTYIVIYAVSIIVGYVINRRKLGFFQKVLFYAGVVYLVYFVLDMLNGDSSYFSYYMDRINDDSYSVAQAGGRKELWIASLGLLVESPLGWDLGLVGYAHNLWLDAARVGGWLSLFVLLLFTVNSLRLTYDKLLRFRNDMFFVTGAACSMIGFYMLFFVEPILDGYLYPFLAYCAVLGMIIGFGGKFTKQ